MRCGYRVKRTATEYIVKQVAQLTASTEYPEDVPANYSLQVESGCMVSGKRQTVG